VDSVLDFLKKKNVNNRDLLIIDTDELIYYSKSFQKNILKEQIRFMYITLFSNFYYWSHYIFNPNVMALDQNFKAEPSIKKFLGPEYFILDDSFKKIKPNIFHPEKKKWDVLVTFGSADPENLTIKLLTILEKYIDVFSKVRIVVGGLNLNYKIILNLNVIKQYPNIFEVHYDTKNIYDLMKNSDVAISSLGLTFWELLLHKIPSFVISGSERERIQLKYFRKYNYCHYLGDFNEKNWQKNWEVRFKEYLNQKESLNLDSGKLYELVNVNGKTKLVKSIISDYE
ncbi:MAG: hypothetical protein KDC67_14380, partial [Ignavibacteriae bacterium]|nr:hypothetical protein [Ignavibacteriota bacterium]